jgi:long-chain fatty acid transport protein
VGRKQGEVNGGGMLMQHKKNFPLSLLALSCGIAMMSMSQPGRASGFQVPEQNVTGLALSNALVANPDSQAAISYNGAAMSFLEGSSLAVGLLAVKPDLKVDTGSGNISSDANNQLSVPSLTAHTVLNETWSIGIAVNAPFGLETEWPAGTFDAQYPLSVLNPNFPTQGLRYSQMSIIPTKSKLETVDFAPKVSYKLSDNFSLSGGLDYYWMKKVIFNGDINEGTPGSNPVANLEGDGHGVGFNLGLMFRQGDWSFGGSYHSKAKVAVDGKVTLPLGTLPPFMSNRVNADIELPWRLQLGVRNKTTDKLAIEFDVTRTGWSSFDKLVVDQDQYGVNIVTSTNLWDDANAYRLGVTYDFTPATQLRVGYTYDETPQAEQHFSPRIPDANRQLFSMGIGHTLANGWAIDAGYMYVKFDKRTINNTTTPVAGSETNGTSAVNGTYDSNVSLFGIGLTKRFM